MPTGLDRGHPACYLDHPNELVRRHQSAREPWDLAVLAHAAGKLSEAQRQSGDAAIAGVRWNTSGRILLQIVRTGVSIVLARLLAPSDFGLMAVAFVVAQFVDVIQDLGTGRALIQRPRLSRELFDSVFVINIAMGSALALLVALCAEPIALAYGQPRDLPSILRYMALGFVLGSAANAQRGVMIRRMEFRRLAVIDVLAATVNGAVAIGMALAQFGVWAMVLGHLASIAFSTTAAWLLSPWLPRARIRREDWLEIQGFSINLTVSNVLGFLLSNADSLLITRLLGADAMGCYSLAQRFTLPARSAVIAVLGVLTPVLSRMEEDNAALWRRLHRAASAVSLVLYPFLIGIALVADLFVEVALPPRWQCVVPVAQGLAVASLSTRTIQVVNTLYFVKGRTDLLLRWIALQGVAILAALCVGMQWGLAQAVASMAVVHLALLYPGLALSLRLIQRNPWTLLLDEVKHIALCVPMVLIAITARVLLDRFNIAPTFEFVVTVSSGAIAYGLTIRLVRPGALDDLRRLLSLS